MNKFYAKSGFSRTGIVLPLLFALLSIASAANAQCPTGSVAAVNNTTYTNGQIACISTTFSGTITLNNGSKLFIASGGSFTGTLNARTGSTVEVARNGFISPSGMWDFKGSFINYGTAVLNNTGFKAGASITNEGTISGSGLYYINEAVTLSNAMCGTMNLATLQVHSGNTFTNNGRLNISGAFEVYANGTFNNRGRLYVSGSSVIAGKVLNESWMVMKGSNNSLSAGDSLINLHYLVYNSAIAVNKPIRNEGLMIVNGTTNFNAGGTLRQTNPSALFKINGGMTRDNVSTTGGYLYASGTIYNNSTINGLSTINKITVNKTMSNIGTNVVIDGSAALYNYDTTNFTDTYGSPLNCQAAGAPTPVKLSRFDAVEKSGKVYLTWATEMEENHDYFAVEYSTDGKNFVSLENIKGKVNSAATQQYSFTHLQPATGFNFYRLRIVSVTGDVEYSNVEKLNLSSGLAAASIRTYPNPFVERVLVDVKIDRAQSIQVYLVDNAGRTLQAKNIQAPAGRQTLELANLASYSKGVYTLVIQTQEEKVAIKLMK